MSDTYTLSERVAEEIRAALARRRMSGRQLATNLGVSQTWMSSRLSGATPIDLNDLERIAAAMSVEVADLLPRPTEGRTVITAGEPARTAAYATSGAPAHGKPNDRKATLSDRTRPNGGPTHSIPKQATRRPARIGSALAGS